MSESENEAPVKEGDVVSALTNGGYEADQPLMMSYFNRIMLAIMMLDLQGMFGNWDAVRNCRRNGFAMFYAIELRR